MVIFQEKDLKISRLNVLRGKEGKKGKSSDWLILEVSNRRLKGTVGKPQLHTEQVRRVLRPGFHVRQEHPITTVRAWRCGRCKSRALFLCSDLLLPWKPPSL